MKAGELSTCDTDGLARVVQEMLHGALVAWAIYREGSARDWVRRDLDYLLGPYLAPSAGDARGACRVVQAKPGRWLWCAIYRVGATHRPDTVSRALHPPYTHWRA